MVVGSDWNFLSRESQEELAKNQPVREQPLLPQQQSQHSPETVRTPPPQIRDELPLVQIDIQEIAVPSTSSTTAVNQFTTLEELAVVEREFATLENFESVAMVLDVYPKCGRLLIPENIGKANLVVFFDLNTVIDGQSICALSSNAQDIIQPGLLVDVVMEASKANIGAGRKIVRGVVRCSSMITYDEQSRFNNADAQLSDRQTLIDDDARKEEPAMVVGVRSSSLGVATTIESEMLLLHNHALVNDELMSAIAVWAEFDSSSPAALRLLEQIKPVLLNESELMTPGRVVMTRTAVTPAWIRQLSADLRCIRYIALTVRPNGEIRVGVGKIVKYLANGGLLQPNCSDEVEVDVVYFALSSLPKTRGDDLEMAWPIGTCLQYEACRELPGRQFEWRAFRLVDGDGSATTSTSTASNLLPIVPSLIGQTTITTRNVTDTICHTNELTISSKSAFEPKRPNANINVVVHPLPSSSSSPPPSTSKRAISPPTQAKRRRLKPRTYAADRLACSDQSETDDDDLVEETASEVSGASAAASEPQTTNLGITDTIFIDQSADLFNTLCAFQRAEQPTQQAVTQQTETNGPHPTVNKPQPTAATAGYSGAISISQDVDVFETLCATAFQPSAALPTAPDSKQQREKNADEAMDSDDDVSDINIADHKHKVLVVGANNRLELITPDQRKQREGGKEAKKKQQKKPLPTAAVCSGDAPPATNSPTQETTKVVEASAATPSEPEHGANEQPPPPIDACRPPSEEADKKLAPGLVVTESELQMLKLLAPETLKFLGL